MKMFMLSTGFLLAMLLCFNANAACPENNRPVYLTELPDLTLQRTEYFQKVAELRKCGYVFNASMQAWVHHSQHRFVAMS